MPLRSEVDGAGAIGGQGAWAGESSAVFTATERILAPIASLQEVREIVLHATDWFGATGSVFGVKRLGTPMESRILAVCAEFVRRTAGSEGDSEIKSQALEAIRKRDGRKDGPPDVVAALRHLAERGEAR